MMSIPLSLQPQSEKVKFKQEIEKKNTSHIAYRCGLFRRKRNIV